LDAPEPLGKFVTLTHYLDANLYHCMLTGRSVTGVLHLLNQCPIDWFSKKQATVETATYGSEFVAARTCVEQIMDLRSTLRYMGVLIRSKSIMFRDNKSVVDSSTKIHTKFHKRHTALSFHRVREATAGKIIGFNGIRLTCSASTGDTPQYGPSCNHFFSGRVTLPISAAPPSQNKAVVGNPT
jgi:hypothetical protein